MKNNNGGHNVKEEKLFHGTDNKNVDVICHTNFDWRICGHHGTAYGKGELTKFSFWVTGYFHCQRCAFVLFYSKYNLLGEDRTVS